MKTMVLYGIVLMLLLTLAASQTVVENLPGLDLPGKLPFKLETGYIGVGEEEDVQLFYYFIESETKPENDPLVLWLTGGPGCSGLSGLIYEIGPFTIDYANSSGSIPGLKLNEYSWTKVANIIFLDQPAGTGFSYAKTAEASYSSDTLAATHTYDFLRKWLISHPKYLKNPLYICGDSYGGIILPIVVDKVYNGIELGREPKMNLRGYSLGNPVTDSYNDLNGKFLYAHRMGLLSDRLYQCVDKVRRTHILEPWCGSLWNADKNTFSYENVPSSLLRSAVSGKTWCRDDNYVFSATWANDKSVQKALHIREGTKTEWARCNTSIASSEVQPDARMPYIRDVQSTTAYHSKFTRKHCRALIYSGDHDLYIPHTSAEKWIDSLKLPILSDWRPWFVEGQVAGYTMTYGQGGYYQLTYATVKGAGHTAPEYKPMECLAMIRNWFSRRDL